MPISQVINHFTGIKIRVNGTGNLKTKLISLNSKNSVTMANLPMSPDTDRTLTRLTNFKSNKVQLEVKVEEFGENFTIYGIAVYVMPIEMEFPQ